ncbi:hypothetical protein B1J93_16585 [Leptospira kirschneri serovar Pomona]|uniref:Uncharacterized protein n=1 Tax=Leptospira kirschneri serovar Pomona TaxID=561005 RepID=A0A1T1DII7_9LEPT|nr:hypothetical protein B1J93_16585 [Leptospira kirschneri serovar Pomona]
MTGAKEPVSVSSFFLQTIGGIRPDFFYIEFTLIELLKNSIVKIRKIASIVHSIQYKQIKN